jgi:hypothetical protein
MLSVDDASVPRLKYFAGEHTYWLASWTLLACVSESSVGEFLAFSSTLELVKQKSSPEAVHSLCASQQPPFVPSRQLWYEAQLDAAQLEHDPPLQYWPALQTLEPQSPLVQSHLYASSEEAPVS